MSQIEINNMSFKYDGQIKQLFNHVNLDLDSNWRLGLVGRNGRGKTTLLKLLQNKLEYQGTITHSVRFTYFPLNVLDYDELAFHSLNINDADEWKLERELNLLHTDPEILWRPFKSLSGGEQTKLLLAILFIDKNNFPLLDEPTNHLDNRSRKQIANYLKSKKQGFILVSHDRHLINQCCNHILAIEKANLKLYQGNFSTYQHEKDLRDNLETGQNKKLQNSIKHLKKTVNEKKKWADKVEKKAAKDSLVKTSSISSSDALKKRSSKIMKRAKTMDTRMKKDIVDKEKLLKNIEHIDPLSLRFSSDYHKALIRVENMQLSYNKQKLFETIDFTLERGQCIVISGNNGSGKTSILKALTNNFDGHVTGKIDIPSAIQISYIQQAFQKNHGTLKNFAEQYCLNYELFLNNLHKLGVERSFFNQKIETMSMGQQKRVEVAKSLSQPAQLYIWDEPLNYLDTYNQEQLLNLITTIKPTLLLIEHDQDFIEKAADKIIKLQPSQ
ncbi:ATPase component of ABC transporter with duplicated ATPase domains [Ligilactobacillus salitolerans]|uniref:ATPase component of ABC transporter with duplicated ATPase domains n=1 Tax=Ligilactobacillus salitolerans TaxID=1808352 RepID=A0A401IVJ1_9LACO|nr:ABC-F type ribosomal protection protein [Ligilactobacillus salitolerans]GBG95554.1 ATPase component of ABC transporter with duplicated ATPase domains [Ligilactobacillus salitolerans]